MITIKNRKVAFHTSDIREQAKVRQVLEEYKMDYKFMIIDNQHPPLFSPLPKEKRRKRGHRSKDSYLDLEYVILVHEKDLERSEQLIKEHYLRNDG